MKKPLANIGILLLLIIVLPPLLFTSYEIGNLYQNEKMIDSIYTRQLESVMFSINQYSDDIVSRWANQLENDLQKNDSIDESFIDGFMKRNSSINLIFVADSININMVFKDTSRSSELHKDAFVQIFNDNVLTVVKEGGFTSYNTDTEYVD